MDSIEQMMNMCSTYVEHPDQRKVNGLVAFSFEQNGNGPLYLPSCIRAVKTPAAFPHKLVGYYRPTGGGYDP